jgi:hypothetical protein
MIILPIFGGPMASLASCRWVQPPRPEGGSPAVDLAVQGGGGCPCLLGPNVVHAERSFVEIEPHRSQLGQI